MARTETVEALCLKAFPYSETSKISLYWTPSHGEVRAMVKGVRKANSTLSGACEALTHNHLVLRMGTSDLSQVTAVTPGERFLGLRHDINRISAAHLLVEWLLCNRLDPHSQELFDWLMNNLHELASLPFSAGVKDLTKTVHTAQMQLMAIVGTPLNLDTCLSCEQPFPADSPVFFAPAWGGAICKTCKQVDPPAIQLVGVSPSTWHVLTDQPHAWDAVNVVKLQQFWLFLAQHWWHQEMKAHHFWLDQVAACSLSTPS